MKKKFQNPKEVPIDQLLIECLTKDEFESIKIAYKHRIEKIIEEIKNWKGLWTGMLKKSTKLDYKNIHSAMLCEVPEIIDGISKYLSKGLLLKLNALHARAEYFTATGKREL